jgi:hypothetical protein
VARRFTIWSKYGFAWVTAGFFLISIAGHWGFGWLAYQGEQRALGQPVEFSGYAIEMARDTFENWQSEFLQLIWQVIGLACLLYVGSSQSKEGQDREEAKLDEILKRLDPDGADKLIAALERRYPKK